MYVFWNKKSLPLICCSLVVVVLVVLELTGIIIELADVGRSGPFQPWFRPIPPVLTDSGQFRLNTTNFISVSADSNMNRQMRIKIGWLFEPCWIVIDCEDSKL